MRRTAAEKRERLLEEAEAHARIKEDTEVRSEMFSTFKPTKLQAEARFSQLFPDPQQTL